MEALGSQNISVLSVTLEPKVESDCCSFFQGLAVALASGNNGFETFSQGVGEKLKPYPYTPTLVFKEFIQENLCMRMITDGTTDYSPQQLEQVYLSPILEDLLSSELGVFHTHLTNLKIIKIALECLIAKDVKSLEPELRLQSTSDLIALLEKGKFEEVYQTLKPESMRKSSSGDGIKQYVSQIFTFGVTPGWEAEFLLKGTLEEITAQILDLSFLKEEFLKIASEIQKPLEMQRVKQIEEQWTKKLSIELKIRPPKLTSSDLFRNITEENRKVVTNKGINVFGEIKILSSYVVYNQTEQLFLTSPPRTKQELIAALLKEMGKTSNPLLIKKFLELEANQMEAFLIKNSEFQLIYYTIFGAFQPMSQALQSAFDDKERGYAFKSVATPNNYIYILGPNKVTQIKKCTVENTNRKLSLKEETIAPRARAIDTKPTRSRSFSARGKTLPLKMSTEENILLGAPEIIEWKQMPTKWRGNTVASFWATLEYDLSKFVKGILDPDITLSIDTIQFHPLITKNDYEHIFTSLNRWVRS